MSRKCVLDAVEAIKDAQDAVELCKTSCFDNLLAPTGVEGDTIPFILKNSDGTPFHALGDVGDENNDCFVSIWFRVEEIRGCCATLQVLKPFENENNPIKVNDLISDGCCVSLKGICKLGHLEKTKSCIEVDLSCFCSIQCLKPSLVLT